MRRIGWIVGTIAALLVPLLTLLLLDRGNESDGCVVYRKLDFDEDKGLFRGVGETEVERSDDSCGGKALLLRRGGAGGAFGAQTPLLIDGAHGIKIAFLCKAKSVPAAMINVWDQHAGDNLTPRHYVPLSADTWTPVRYQVDDFRYNGSTDPNSRARSDAFLQNLLFHGEPEGSTNTWLLIDNLVVYRGKDDRAPDYVHALRVESTARSMRLTWQPATDNVGVMRYDVARASAESDDYVAIAQTCPPTWTDPTPPRANPRYRVRAVDYEENAGPWSDVAHATNHKPED